MGSPEQLRGLKTAPILSLLSQPQPVAVIVRKLGVLSPYPQSGRRETNMEKAKGRRLYY